MRILPDSGSPGLARVPLLEVDLLLWSLWDMTLHRASRLHVSLHWEMIASEALQACKSVLSRRHVRVFSSPKVPS